MGSEMCIRDSPCVLEEGTLAYSLYSVKEIGERHRHRWEVNNAYRETLEEKGLVISGLSPDGDLVEIVEYPDHPFFISSQFHPELKSRPQRAHPLFKGLVAAAKKRMRERQGEASAAVRSD